MKNFTVAKFLGIVFLLSIAAVGCNRTAAAGKPAAGTVSITTGVWQLSAIQRPGGAETAVAKEPSYTAQFGADNRIAGQAHCNRHMGKYELGPTGAISITAGASTLMMCIGESIADEFLKTLGTITRYETRDGRLILSSGTGARLVFVTGQ